MQTWNGFTKYNIDCQLSLSMDIEKVNYVGPDFYRAFRRQIMHD